MIVFPKEIYAAPEGQFGQGIEPIKLAPWTVTPIYERSQSYVRSDIADEMLEALITVSELHSQSREDVFDEAMREVRAAIAKAKG